MSEYKYDTLLSHYPFLVNKLDVRFGGPKYDKETQVRGRKELVQILKHLSIYKQSTSKEIAKAELNKKPNAKVKLKSREDYFRKFIHKYLIPNRLVKVDGLKRQYNNNAEAYSLTVFGILYSIHFFSKDEDAIINNLAIEYKNDLPKVFGRWDLFKKKLGSDFLEIIGLRQISETGDQRINALSTTPPEALMDIIRDDAIGWSGDRLFATERWINQLSLMVYNNILTRFDTKSRLEHNTVDYKDETQEKMLNHLWGDFLKSEPEIRKWFLDFLDQAVTAYKKRTKDVSQIRSWLK